MGFTGGLIAVAVAVALTLALKARGLEEKAFARNWMALVGVTMIIMLMFIGGIAAVITTGPKGTSTLGRQLGRPIKAPPRSW